MHLHAFTIHFVIFHPPNPLSHGKKIITYIILLHLALPALNLSLTISQCPIGVHNPVQLGVTTVALLLLVSLPNVPT